jgi:energy-coupling factor transporter ATP-binding protein EcfA2
MMGSFGGIGVAIDAKLDEGVLKMREVRRAATDERVRRVCQQAAAMADTVAEDGLPGLGIQLTDDRVSIGDVSAARRSPTNTSLVPSPSFVPIAGHVALLREMLLEWEGGGHLLLLGDQGVGKNKLADALLQMLRAEREYVQLHRDTTVASLTLAPCLEGGIVSWRDSPLVRAARLGRVLVVDEADKAPLEVVCVIKALAEDGDLTLGDGRRLVCSRLARSGHGPGGGGPAGDEGGGGGRSHMAADVDIIVSPAFRMLVLANPPGYPFQGNDFYRECGDVFGALAVPNPDAQSQAQLLRRVAPALPRHDLATLLSLFARLKLLHAQGQLAYPYSVRAPGSLAAPWRLPRAACLHGHS